MDFKILTREIIILRYVNLVIYFMCLDKVYI